MKNLLTMAAGAVAKSLPILGVGAEIKAQLETEIKAAGACLFGLGFSACLGAGGLGMLAIAPERPGYGLGALIVSAGMAYPLYRRLMVSKQKLDNLRPLVESAQKVGNAANGAIMAVAGKADSVISAARGLLQKIKQ